MSRALPPQLEVLIAGLLQGFLKICSQPQPVFVHLQIEQGWLTLPVEAKARSEVRGHRRPGKRYIN